MAATISIITPCLNRRDFVAHAVESVLAQNYPDFEHLIIDGGSTDGTLDVLAGYPHLTVISEADCGIYDALNKGIAIARGSLIGHLNTDDSYCPGAFQAVVNRFAESSTLDSVCGAATIQAEGQAVASFSSHRALQLNYETALLGSPVINARFFRHELHQRVGAFDLAYPLSADRDFLVRALHMGLHTAIIDTPIYVYQMHAGSRTFNAHNSAALELSREYATMAERWLARDGIPDELARCCRRLRGEAHGRLAMAALREGRFAGACGALFSRDGQFSLLPSADLLRAIWGRLRRHALSNASLPYRGC